MIRSKSVKASIPGAPVGGRGGGVGEQKREETEGEEEGHSRLCLGHSHRGLWMARIWGEEPHTQFIHGVPSHTGKPAENAEAVGCTQGLCGVFKFSWRALSPNSDSGPKSTCFLLSLPTRREGVCRCLHPSP